MMEFEYAFSDLFQIGSKFGHQATSLALVPKLATRLCNLHRHIALDCPIGIIREGFKNPRHGNFPLGGYPPGASTDEIFPKS